MSSAPSDEHADPEDRRHAHVPVDGLRDAEPEPLDVLVCPRMRPRRGCDGARDDERSAQRQPGPHDGATHPPRPDRLPQPLLVTPGLQHDHGGEGDDEEREQEVGHDGQRMEIEDHRDAAERNLRHSAQEGPERGEPHEPR